MASLTGHGDDLALVERGDEGAIPGSKAVQLTKEGGLATLDRGEGLRTRTVCRQMLHYDVMRD